ncbi:MAG: SpoIIE family protein phosphatase [Chloroflexi bacterium]|nr:SpoIIE family protein phosphatase [Chloroflexota bacterium]
MPPGHPGAGLVVCRRPILERKKKERNMLNNNSPYIFPLLLAALVSLIIAFYTWRRRTAPGALAFGVVTLAMTEWSLANAFQWASAGQEAQLFWARTRFLGAELVVAAFLVFALQYAGRQEWFNRRTALLLLIVPVPILLLLWTNDSHHLFWSTVNFDDSGSFNMLSFTFGPVFWVHTAYDYLLLTLGVLTLTQVFLRSPWLYRRQVAALLIGTLLPWVANMIYIFGLSPIPELDLTPFGFTVGGLVMAWGFFRFGLFEIVPAARQAVIEEMYDAIVVLDEQDHVVDVNPAAERIIGHKATEVVGLTGAEMLRRWSHLVEKYRHVAELASEEIVVDREDGQRHYNLRISPLIRKGRRTGRLIMLQDITDQRKAEKELRHSQEKTLTILENLEDAYFEADLAGNLTYVNEAFAVGIGYSRDEILGRNYRHFTDPGQVRTIFEVFNTVYRTGQPNIAMEYALLRRDGSKGIGEASVSLVRNEGGEPVGFRGIIRDVTDRRRAEEAIRQAREAAERELEIGRRIQAGFLPDVLPEVAGWEIGYFFQSARVVAGDFYDAFTLSRGKRVALVMADVCDKGVGAALFMALFRSLIRAFAFQHYSTSLLDLITNDDSLAALGRAGKKRTALPTTGTTALKEAIALTNNYIAQHHGHTNMFATLFFGVLDPGSGALTYINGGHEPPLIIGRNGVKARLEPTGPAVGMLPDMEYEMQETILEPGDTLLAFTDGVTEARNVRGAFFSEEQLLAIAAGQHDSVAGLLDQISSQLHGHMAGTEQSDDIAMLAIRRTSDTPTPSPRPERKIANLLEQL